MPDTQEDSAFLEAGQDVLTTDEAAQALGITKDAVRKRIHRGTLRGAKLGGIWHVPKQDVEDETGRPASGGRVVPSVLEDDATGGTVVDALQATTARQRAEIERQAAEIQSLKAMLEATSTQLYERLADSQDQVEHLRRQNEELIALLRTAVERIGR